MQKLITNSSKLLATAVSVKDTITLSVAAVLEVGGGGKKSSLGAKKVMCIQPLILQSLRR